MFDAFVAFQARMQPRAMAILSPERQSTYAELDADVNRFANGLTALGVTPADGVISIDEGNYLKCVIVLALARMGIASSPGNDEAADILISDRDRPGPPRGLWLTDEWVAATLASDAQRFTAPPKAPDMLGRVMLSSGTTKTPRRVGLSWRMVDAGVRSVAATYGAGRAGRWIPFTGIESIMGFHISLACWAAGGTLVVGVEGPDLPKALETLQPGLLGFTPTFLRTLLRDLPPDFVVQPGLRLVVGGGALPQSVAREARLRLSPDLKIIYGATECSGAASADATLLETTPGIAGYAAPGVRVLVVDADGAPLPAGVQGEVRIEAERAACSYIDDPVETAAAFRNGGFYPGDLGRMTADGLLVIDGRLDDRMNLGGHKFQPTTMDDVALDCPGVADAAAFAVPDAAGIDHCWLAVVQGEGFDRAMLLQQLQQHRPALPPVRFAFTDAIPRNAMGKVERQRLRDETMAALGLSPPA